MAAAAAAARDDEEEEKKVNFAQKLKRDTFRGLPDFSHYSIWHQDFQNPRLCLSQPVIATGSTAQANFFDLSELTLKGTRGERYHSGLKSGPLA